MGITLNPFTGLLEITGSGGSDPHFHAPVADESLLPASGISGELVVVEDTDHIYVYDSNLTKWVDTGLIPSSIGSSPNGAGYTLAVDSSGPIVRNELVLQPADDSNPGIVTIGNQNFSGDKSFLGNIFLPNQTFDLPLALDPSGEVIAQQIRLTQDVQDILPIFNGGTNSGTPLNNNRVMISSGGAIVEEAAITSGKALVTDTNGLPSASVTTTTELSYVSGVTSAVQAQLDSKIPLTQKAANNGVATLDSGGKVPLSQLPASILEYQGTWNASTNTPTLADGTGTSGFTYRVNVAGTQNLGNGSLTFVVGDWVIYDGAHWQLAHAGADAVISVNGQSGVVTLTTDNVSEGATNEYFTNARAQAAITGAASTITTSNLTADRALISNGSGKVTVSVTTNTELGYVSGVTSAIQTQLNAITGSAITSLTGDVTATGPGASASTVHTVGGATAANIASATSTVLNSESGNTFFASPANGSSGTPAFRSIVIADIPTSGPGDIVPTTFSFANNQSSAADITGFVFSNAAVGNFRALVGVKLLATTSLYGTLTLIGTQKGSSWDLSYSYTGDDTGLVFSITNSGQVQYQSPNSAGFSSGTIKFSAATLAF